RGALDAGVEEEAVDRGEDKRDDPVDHCQDDRLPRHVPEVPGVDERVEAALRHRLEQQALAKVDRVGRALADGRVGGDAAAHEPADGEAAARGLTDPVHRRYLPNSVELTWS